MTDLLKDVLQERADRLAPVSLDPHAMVRDGQRRARRRTTLLGAGLAGTVIVGVAGSAALLGGGDGVRGDRDTVVESPLAAAFAAHTPTWSEGNVVHIDGTTIDLGRQLRAYVQTDLGLVYSDGEGDVWQTQGGESTEVGRTVATYPHLVADGTLAAWLEPAGDQAPVFAVLDQSTGKVTRSSLGNEPGMDVIEGRDLAQVLAIDGQTVYVLDARGAVAWDLTTGDSTVVEPKAKWDDLADVKNGVFVYRAPRTNNEDFWETYAVGPAPGVGLTLKLTSANYLSPDARYLIGEPDYDNVQVFDVATGEQMPNGGSNYEYFGAYQWIDNDTYAAVGFQTVTDSGETGPTDILSCEVLTGECSVVATDVAPVQEGFSIPTGQYIH